MTDTVFSSPSQSCPPDKTEDRGFLDVFYDTLFHPVKHFQQLLQSDEASKNRYFLYAAIIVMIVSGMTPLLDYIQEGGGGQDLKVLLLQVIFQSITGLLLWILFASIVALLSYALTGKGQIKNFLMVSAYTSLPTIFMAPLALFKQGLGFVGTAITMMGTFIIGMWAITLVGLSLGITYQLTFERVVIILLILCPILALIGFSLWMTNLGANLIFHLL